MNNYRCLNDNDCNILYAYEVFKPEDITILKSDEMVVARGEHQVVNDITASADYVLYGVLALFFIILFAAFLNKVFTR